MNDEQLNGLLRELAERLEAVEQRLADMQSAEKETDELYRQQLAEYKQRWAENDDLWRRDMAEGKQNRAEYDKLYRQRSAEYKKLNRVAHTVRIVAYVLMILLLAYIAYRLS